MKLKRILDQGSVSADRVEGSEYAKRPDQMVYVISVREKPSVRLYSYPAYFSPVWTGKIDLDEAVASEAQLFDAVKSDRKKRGIQLPADYAKTVSHYVLPEHYQTFEYERNNSASRAESEKFLKAHASSIVFCRYDNSLFGVWADLRAAQNESKEKEIGLVLKDEMRLEFANFIDGTIFPNAHLTGGDLSDLVAVVNGVRVKESR